MFNKLIKLNLLITSLSPFLSLSNSTTYYNAEDKTITCNGYSSVMEDLTSLQINLDDYTTECKDRELITVSLNIKDDCINTYIYIFESNPDIRYLSCNVSNSLDKNDNNEFLDDFSTKDISLVSYTTDYLFRKYLIKDLSIENSILKRISISVMNGKDINGNHIYINCSSSFIFNGKNNNDLECQYDTINSILITDKIVGNVMEGKVKWNGQPHLSYLYKDMWYCFFNTDISLDKIVKVSMGYKFGTYYIGTCLPFNFVLNYDNLHKFHQGEEIFLNYKDFDPITQIYFGSFKTQLTLSDNLKETISEGESEVIVNKGYFSWSGKKVIKTANIIDLENYNSDDYNFENYDDGFKWGVYLGYTDRYYYTINADSPLYSNNNTIYTHGHFYDDLIILKLTAYKDGVLKDYACIDVFTDPSFSVDNTFGKIDFGSFFSKYIYIVVLIVIVLILGAISSFLEPVKNVLLFIINLVKNILNFVLSLILWPFKAIFIGDTSFWLW